LGLNHDESLSNFTYNAKLRRYIGVSLMLSPVTMSRICQLGALSPAGRCRTLDASADGYGRSEGCLAFVITAADAAAPLGGGGGGGGGDGFESAVYIAGSAVNQDGRSSSLTTPNGASQQSLLRAAAFQAVASTRSLLSST
jgi:acyl transferase domain-containing protein